MRRYFVSCDLAGEKIEKEVSLEAYCAAERQAGFYPKLATTDPRFMTTPATRSFGAGAISGRLEYQLNETIGEKS